MSRHGAVAIALAAAVLACGRGGLDVVSVVDAAPDTVGAEVSSPDGASAADVDSAVDAGGEDAFDAIDIEFVRGRTAYVVAPPGDTPPRRLVAHLHGLCAQPRWSCGKWRAAAVEVGLLLCPRGDGICADGAPSWRENDYGADLDLERSIEATTARFPTIDREGAILTGFSRGAYMAVHIALRHPGRWPYLVLTEGNPVIDAASLRAGGVRAVAMIAGETGLQVDGERQTVRALEAAGFPARLWVMARTGHRYSPEIVAIMREAFAFLAAH